MTIGPASAMIRALGWTTVRAPEKNKKSNKYEQHILKKETMQHHKIIK